MFSAGLRVSPEYSACSAYSTTDATQQPARSRPSSRSRSAPATPRAAAHGARQPSARRAAARAARRPRRPRYSGISRLTVRPSAEIGRRNGSARIASSGNASARRRISSDEQPRSRRARRPAPRRRDARARERRRRASIAHADHGPTSVKLRGESTVRSLCAQAHAHAIFAGRRERAAVDAAASTVRAVRAPCDARIAVGDAATPVPAQRELFVARDRMVAHERRDRRRPPSRRSSPSPRRRARA